MFWNPLTRLCGASVLCEIVQFFLLQSGLSGDQQLDVSILYHF